MKQKGTGTGLVASAKRKDNSTARLEDNVREYIHS